MRSLRPFALSVASLGILLTSYSQTSVAASDDWKLHPVSGDWNTPDNWEDGVIPEDRLDIASFGPSTRRAITASATAEVGELLFLPDASAFTFTAKAAYFQFTGEGIVNESAVVQKFVSLPSAVGDTYGFVFENMATAGSLVDFKCYGYSVVGGSGGYVFFDDGSSAGSATIHNFPALVRGGAPGRTSFWYHSTAAESTIINEGATIPGALGGITDFGFGHGSAGNATFICLGGKNGGTGGGLLFEYQAQGGSCSVTLFGNGYFDLSYLGPIGATIGSLEGNGVVYLGGKLLSVGSNSRSTVFSGLIRDGGLSGSGTGKLSKVGDGALTLRGSNTYSRGTTVEGGTLLVGSADGSSTGSGSVQVNAGTFGGEGQIAGAIIIGKSGGGAGAYLAPGIDGPGSLGTERDLSFELGSGYNCELDRESEKVDSVSANGVVIGTGVIFNLLVLHDGPVEPGTLFTVIDNTSGNPINGSFSNLPDDSTLTVADLTFRASYEGGDGNDLVLTVQP